MSHACKMCVNLRSQAAGLRGVQRYTAEVRRRLGERLRDIAPSRPLLGLKGHLWEQSVLPVMVGRGCLWSPANTGPLMTAEQVVTIHDVAPLEHPEWFNPHFAAWYRWLTPRLVKRVKKIITVSAFSRERLVKAAGASAAKIVVIPEGVDSRFHPHTALETRRMSAALAIPSVHYVLSVGALEPRKNLAGLLAAWSLC